MFLNLHKKEVARIAFNHLKDSSDKKRRVLFIIPGVIIWFNKRRII